MTGWEKRQQLPEPARAMWLCEAAWFEAVFRKDLAAARNWMEHSENRKGPALPDRRPDLGVVKSIRESLARITAQPPRNPYVSSGAKPRRPRTCGPGKREPPPAG